MPMNMSQSRVRLTCLAAMMAGCFAPLARPSLEAAKKAGGPNVILIMADDLGAEGLGCYDSTQYHTPRLDKMAGEGTLFRNAYTTPLCTPTRVMIMSGQYPQKTGFRTLIGKGKEERMPAALRTFGHYFRDAGYATAIAGKWQLGQFEVFPDQPRESGFDEYCLWKWVWKGKKTSRFYEPAIWQNGESADGDESVYGPDVFADFVIDFIGRKRDEPFFVYYPMTLVHLPFVLPPELAEETDAKLSGKEGQNVRNYAHMITYMDGIVGRILDQVAVVGQEDNTLVIFTGDNGCPSQILSRLQGLDIQGGKGKMIEAGSRIPLIARWPGRVPAGVESETLICLADLVPSMNALVGVETRDEVDGIDLSHQFVGGKGVDRETVFIHYGKDYFVRDGRWRLHRNGAFYDIPTTTNASRYAEKKDEGPEDEAERARLAAVLAPYAAEVEAAEESGIFAHGRGGEKSGKGERKKGDGGEKSGR
jgi:arylsulfatase A